MSLPCSGRLARRPYGLANSISASEALSPEASHTNLTTSPASSSFLLLVDVSCATAHEKVSAGKFHRKATNWRTSKLGQWSQAARTRWVQSWTFSWSRLPGPHCGSATRATDYAPAGTDLQQFPAHGNHRFYSLQTKAELDFNASSFGFSVVSIRRSLAALSPRRPSARKFYFEARYCAVGVMSARSLSF